MRRVLRDVQEFRAHFSPVVIDHLVHLVAPQPAPVTEEKPAVTIQPKSIESAEKFGIPEVRETTPVHFGLEPELEEAAAKEPVMRDVVSRTSSPTYDDKRLVIGGIEFVKIPAGRFLMGSKEDNKLAYDEEKPQHTIEIAQDYWMARFPVTNEQYAAYLGKGTHPVSDWQKKKEHPVNYIEWKDAMAYCKWLNNFLAGKLPQGLALRLPTEAEWEKAARGEYGNEWPWGNEFDKSKCNSSEGGKGGTTPVGLYSPQGDSPYGCADMVGNVWEWTHSLFKAYPYQAGDGRENETASGRRVLRGGSFLNDSRYARCACRRDALGIGGGFRVAASPVSPVK